MIKIMCEECESVFYGRVNEFLCPLCAKKRRAEIKEEMQKKPIIKKGKRYELSALWIESNKSY